VRRQLLIAGLAGVVLFVLVIAGVFSGGGSSIDVGGGVPPTSTAPTTSTPVGTTPEGRPVGGGCGTPRPQLRNQIVERATDVVDFGTVQTARAPGGALAVSAPLRPATQSSAVATWLVAGTRITSANADAAAQSSFPAASPSVADRAAVARSQTCVRAVLPPG
jgi:hypothetical protein